MRFTMIQSFDAPVDAVAAAYADDALYPFLVGLPKLGAIEPLEQRLDGDTVEQRIRFRFTGHLPAAVTAVVDPAKLSWVQETAYDLTARSASFRLVPDHYPDRLSASGTFGFLPADDGSQRRIDGEVRVRALLVSGKVEQAIVSGLEEYLAAEAPRVDAWIADAR